MKYYETNFIEMGFCKDDADSSTADSTEWNDPNSPDMYNVLVTEHSDDGTGEVELVLDLDFPPAQVGLAQQMHSLVHKMALYAINHHVPFGSVFNYHK